MRASVSPGKITHTHSQWRGTNAGYSPPLLNIWLERNDLSSPPLLTGRNWPGHVWHLSKSFSTHTHTSLYMYVWPEKEKAFCYLLIRFRARRVLAIKPWQPARLAPGLAERQRSPSQAATQNNTYTEAKLPLVGEQFPSLGENSLCFNITTTRTCTEVCACICVFLVPDTCSHQGWVTSKHLIYALQTLSCRMRSQRTLGANSSQSNKL